MKLKITLQPETQACYDLKFDLEECDGCKKYDSCKHKCAVDLRFNKQVVFEKYEKIMLERVGEWFTVKEIAERTKEKDWLVLERLNIMSREKDWRCKKKPKIKEFMIIDFTKTAFHKQMRGKLAELREEGL